MKYNPSIKSVAIDLPEKYCPNTESPYSDIPNIPKNWWRLWGIKGRYNVNTNKGESCSTLAKNASEKAINKAGINIKDVDLIIGTTCTITEWSDKKPETIFPGISEYLKTELQCDPSTMTIEVNQACISFLVALQIASDYIKTGLYKNVLICSAETFSVISDFQTPAASLFGDGAAAVIVGRSEKDGHMISSAYKSISHHNEIATLQWRQQATANDKKMIRSYLTLEEDAATKMQTFVPENVPKVTMKALEKAKLKVNEINHFVLHQPSTLLMKMWAMGLGIKKDKYTVTVSDYSCLSSASIPLTLYVALRDKKIKPNDTIAFAGAGIGWSFGAQIWKIENINY